MPKGIAVAVAMTCVMCGSSQKDEREAAQTADDGQHHLEPSEQGAHNEELGAEESEGTAKNWTVKKNTPHGSKDESSEDQSDASVEKLAASANPSTSFKPVENDSPPVASTDQENLPPTLNVLLTYAKSPDSSVRMRAVKNLIRVRDARATLALEDRMKNDSSIQVRLAAVDGLVARRSLRSVPIMRRLVMTAATSNERARIQRAIRQLMGISE
ncbi:MAG: HEAT repeat domain-containing protein [Proteobacteria bacterium]|nr:HEAT repeat domain-containing protein [Pseudomonadota bacterium]